MRAQSVNSGDGISWTINEVARAIAGGDPLSGPVARERHAAVIELTEAFEPGSPLEDMFASRCVGMHALFLDDLRITLVGEAEGTRRATRTNMVRMDACLMRNLTRFEKLQDRRLVLDEGVAAAAPRTKRRALVPVAAKPAPDSRVQPPEPPVREPDAGGANEAAAPIAGMADGESSPVPAAACAVAAPAAVMEGDAAAARDKVADRSRVAVEQRHNVAAARALELAARERTLVVHAAKSVPAPTLKQSLASFPLPIGGAAVARSPFDAAVAAVKANPQAMAALDAGDPKAFARALGVRNPDREFLAEAARAGGPFDPLTKFSGEPANGGRRARK